MFLACGLPGLAPRVANIWMGASLMIVGSVQSNSWSALVPNVPNSHIINKTMTITYLLHPALKIDRFDLERRNSLLRELPPSPQATRTLRSFGHIQPTPLSS